MAETAVGPRTVSALVVTAHVATTATAATAILRSHFLKEKKKA
jgi:hypothetical protein